MSLFSSFIIDPVVRQARRFSGASPPQAEAETEAEAEADRRALSHARHALATSTLLDSGDDLDHSDNDNDNDSEDGKEVDDGDVHGQGHGQASPHAVLANTISRPRRRLTVEASASSPTLASLSSGDLQALPVSSSRRATAPSQPSRRHASIDASMTANPSLNFESQLRQLQLDDPDASSSSAATTEDQSLASQSQTSDQPTEQHAPAMSETLPADDGMRHLRSRIHQINGLGVDEVEKARMMHGIMTERYHLLRPTSPSSFASHDRPFTPTSAQSVFSDGLASSPRSSASDRDPDNPFDLQPGDTDPTYRTSPAHEHEGAAEDDDVEEEVSFGCEHYKRNVKVQCFDCRRWYTCRHCHDAVEDHNLNRVRTQNMLCMACGTPQKAAEYCVKCELQAACYYCAECKLWDNNSAKKIYHCADCGICRRGEGLGKDYYHCKVRLLPPPLRPL